jgi:hypothetical protein
MTKIGFSFAGARSAAVRKLLGAALGAAAIILLVAGTASAQRGDEPQVIFNSILSPLPGDVPSDGAEAYNFNEFGDGIVFPSSTGGTLKTVTVVLVSFACQQGTWNGPSPCVSGPGATFSWPITMNIYAPDTTSAPTGFPSTPAWTPGASAGTRLATLTKTFRIPYRPSTTATQCGVTTPGGDGLGDQWYDKQDGRCHWGIAVPITFDFSEERISLPPAGTNEVIIGVTYNTSYYGHSPVGTSAACYKTTEGCPYDALNIAVYGGLYFSGTEYPNPPYPPSFGNATSVFDPNGVFVTYGPVTAGGTPSPCNSLFPYPTLFFGDDSGTAEGCWSGAHPMLQITAKCGGRGQPQCPVTFGTNLSGLGDLF